MQLATGAGARVAEVTDDWITIDANHQLAGKTLHYDVELLSLTKVPSGRGWHTRSAFATVRSGVLTANITTGSAKWRIDT